MPGTSVTPPGTELPRISRRGYSNALAGTATAFLLRSLGDKTGIPHSATAERLFFELTSASVGSHVDTVATWLTRHEDLLRTLGYRIVSRRVALKPDFLMQWVKTGKGFRGAILQVDRARLYGADIARERINVSHAIALCVEQKSRKWAVTMVDPHPASDGLCKPPSTLESAHRLAKHGALVLHWTGWS